MIWLFDSWFWWLTVLKEFHKLLPKYDYCYFGDNARCPYGDLSHEMIEQYTEEWVQFLFDQGATIVILACNTATAHTIKYLQQVRFPDRKILGVTIPGAERVYESGYRKVGVLATQSSVNIRAYKDRVHFHDKTIEVQEIAAPELVPLIEQWIYDTPEIIGLVTQYINQFDSDIDALVLGCTHYPIIRRHIEKRLPLLPIIDPGLESALKFREYLGRHPDIEKNLSRWGELRFFTSGDTKKFQEMGSIIFWRPFSVTRLIL